MNQGTLIFEHSLYVFLVYTNPRNRHNWINQNKMVHEINIKYKPNSKSHFKIPYSDHISDDSDKMKQKYSVTWKKWLN